jgi:hypothetical protein
VVSILLCYDYDRVLELMMDINVLLAEVLALSLMIAVALAPTAVGYLYRKER